MAISYRYTFPLVAVKILLGLYSAFLVPSTVSILQLVIFHIKLCTAELSRSLRSFR